MENYKRRNFINALRVLAVTLGDVGIETTNLYDHILEERTDVADLVANAESKIYKAIEFLVKAEEML